MKRAFILAVLAWTLAATSFLKAAHPAPGTNAKDVNALMEKLNRLILPEEPEVAGQTLAMAIEKLRVKARDADTASLEFERGVNIVIINGGETELPNTSGLKLGDVPFAEAIRHITEQAGMKFRVDANAVVITKDGSKPAPLTAADAPTEREENLVEKLTHVIVPRVSLQDCSLAEAAKFLQSKLRSSPFDGDVVPINIVLNLGLDRRRAPISLELRDVPMATVLDYMAEMHGLELSLHHSAVVFSERGKSPPLPPTKRNKPSETEMRASRLMLPSVELAEVEFSVALEFLFIKAAQPVLNPEGWGFGREASTGGKEIPPVTLSLNNISFADTLEHLATVSGLELSFEAGKFIFKPLP